MRKLLLAPFLLLFVLTSCASLGLVTVEPETPRERLVAAETDYTAVVTTVRDLINTGTLKAGTQTADHVSNAIVTARAALDAWQLAPDSEDELQTGLLALRALQSVLNSLQAGLDNG